MRRLAPLLLLLSLTAPSCDGCDKPPDTPYKASKKELEQEFRRLEKRQLIQKAPVKKHDKSKTLTVAVPYLPDHLNPWLAINRWGYRIAMHQIYEGLVRRDPRTGKLTGALATSWQMEEEGKVYRFWIRKGVRWQDGRPLSVEDVLFTFNLLTMPKVKKGPFISDIDHSLMRVDKVGGRGVRIVLSHPNAYFLEHLAELPIIPAHVFYKGVSEKSRGSSSPVGTGPYRLYQWIRGESVILERNEFYWGPTPEVQRVVFRKIPDPAKAFVGIRRHQVDLLPEISPVHYPVQITESIKDHYKLYRFVPPDFSYLLWNTRDPILSDFRIRRALSLLIDRKGIAEKVFRGLAVPCEGPFWRPGGLGDSAIAADGYNPEKARELLAQVGWTDHDGDGIRDLKGRPMKLIVLHPVGAKRGLRVLEAIKNNYFRMGIDMVIVPTDWHLLGQHLKKRKFSAAYLTWRGRPYEDFSPIFHSEGRFNYSVVYSIFIDKLLARMRRSLTFTGLSQLSILLERNLAANPPMAFLFRPVHMSIVSRRFANVVPSWDGFRYASFRLDPAHRPPGH